MELKSRAESLIRDQSTMTLATTGDNDPWAAPVYYVYYRTGFYFFSSPASRHIQAALDSGRAAAAIFAAAASWEHIRGIQMSGSVTAVSVGLEAAAAVGSYLKKFPFTRNFFAPGDSVDPDAFSKRFNVRLYRFHPTLVYYSDNSIRFGFREPVDL